MFNFLLVAALPYAGRPFVTLRCRLVDLVLVNSHSRAVCCCVLCLVTFGNYFYLKRKMDEDNNILKIGSNINIKRTDGRVHPAYVAGINFDQDIAMVEWFEHGETKGKEVSFASVTELNSDVIISRPNNQAHVPAEPEVVTQPLPQVYDLRRDSGSSGEETSAAAAQANRYKLDESDDDFNSNQFSPETATLSNPTQANVPSSRSSIARATSRSTRMSYIPSTSNGHTSETANREQAPNFETTRATTNASSNVRCSNVVKEVEKLKRNREERRQKQAEEKAEKEAFLQMAPGNPHWALFNMIQEFRRTLDIRPLNENDTVEDHLITVCVRKRPLNRKEMNKKEVDVITVPSKNQLIVHEPKNKVDLTKYLENQLFRFDYAFDETCTNEMVYRYTAQPLIKTIFEGGFATCFAYGQTGSGKTHTMGGDFVGKNQDCQKGIYGMVAADVFRFIKSSKYRHLDLVVSSSFFEIYSGKVFDLLNNKAKLRILEDGKQQVQVVGLSEIVVSSAEEVLKLIQKGNQARTSGQTFANSNSSRSHAVFQIYLRARNSLEKIHGKFSLIDLAGNERGADTSSADRQTRMEGAEINKSLLALKECIRALSRKGAHLPFRVSKLTLVLKDSFVGSNSRTCMIAMVSPGVNSCEHTLNTLRYADRVKELGAGDLQTPVINEEAENDGDISQLLLNENEMTPEMLNFHQVISELQIAEDNMLDTHKQTIEGLHAVIEKSQKLLRATDGINFDQEAYCNQWEELLNFSSDLLLKAKKSVAEFRTKLIAEEQLSRHSNK